MFAWQNTRPLLPPFLPPLPRFLPAHPARCCRTGAWPDKSRHTTRCMMASGGRTWGCQCQQIRHRHQGLVKTHHHHCSLLVKQANATQSNGFSSRRHFIKRDLRIMEVLVMTTSQSATWHTRRCMAGPGGGNRGCVQKTVTGSFTNSAVGATVGQTFNSRRTRSLTSKKTSQSTYGPPVLGPDLLGAFSSFFSCPLLGSRRGLRGFKPRHQDEARSLQATATLQPRRGQEKKRLVPPVLSTKGGRTHALAKPNLFTQH